MENEDKIESKRVDDGDDSVDMVIELSNQSDGGISQVFRVSEECETKDDKSKKIKDDDKIATEENVHENSHEIQKDEKIEVQSEEKINVAIGEEKKSENVNFGKNVDSVENLEDDKEIKSNDVFKIEEDNEKITKCEKKIETDVEMEGNETNSEEIEVTKTVDVKKDNELDVNKKDSKILAIDDKIEGEVDIKDPTAVSSEELDHESGTEEENKVVKVTEENVCERDKTENAPKDDEKDIESTPKEFNENKNIDNTNLSKEIDVMDDHDVKKDKDEKGKEVSLTKEEEKEDSKIDKGNMVMDNTIEDEGKQNSEVPENSEKKDSAVADNQFDSEEKKDSDMLKNIEKKHSMEIDNEIDSEVKDSEVSENIEKKDNIVADNKFDSEEKKDSEMLENSEKKNITQTDNEIDSEEKDSKIPENSEKEGSMVSDNKIGSEEKEGAQTPGNSEKKNNNVMDKTIDNKEKQDSGIPENSEKKDNGEKVPEEISEQLQMDADDEDKHSDEIPDQINFVDCNAPPPCESPLLIDDDDDDDDIICMVDKGKTSTKARRRNRRTRGSSPEILQDGTNKKRQEIVIDLDDDDDDIEIETIKKRRKRNRSGGAKGIGCCNIECRNQDEDLRRAPVFVLTYYGRKYKKGKPDKVCGQCFEEAMQHQEHLSYLLSEHKPLFGAQFRPRNDTVVLSDSDEEGGFEDEYVPEDVLKDIQNQLEEVLESTVEKYDLDYQVKESENILNEKLDKLTAEFNETDNLLNELQKKMDQLRYDVYKDFIPKIRELPAMTIDDSQCGVKEPVISISPQRTVNQSQKPQQQFSRQQQQQQKQSIVQNRIPVTSSPQTPQKQRFGPVQSHSSSSSPQDPFRKSPLAGVATKKVTQIQRSLGPNQSEVRQEDVVALEQVEVTHKPLPPIGPITRPKPRSGDIMYVMKLSFYGVWSRAKVLEVVPKGSELQSGILSMYNMYKVKFESSYRKSNPVKQVTGKQMAYTTPSPVRFPVGTRVIAIFQDNDWSKECYYSGVIAEPPKSMNNYRYLVFFDDGYAQYVTHEKILLVCESSRNVWEDIHPDSREFIRKYLEQYPERPMVKLQQGQIVKTEWNGKWWIARVVEVDGSLVKMHFDADGRTEWIYRGSTRLGPLYAELAHAAARKEQGTFSRHRGLGVASLKKRNMPYVEYTRGTDGEELRRDDSGEGHTSSESAPARAVAKKSTTKRPESMDRGYEQNNAHPAIDKSQKHQGQVEYLQLNTSKRPRKFEPHQCGPNCLSGAEYDPKAMRGMNPLVIPMLCAWERQVNRCRGKRLVMYRAPCGRRLRNMEELHRYLRIAKSNMSVDLFDFDFWVHCFAEFVLEKGFSNIKDLSYGAEHVPVPCVNCVDHTLPDYVTYSTKREPTDGVNLNLDKEFLTGCDCTDDCQDRDKCACWQLTIQGTAYGPGGVVDPTVGYIYRRLPEPVMTGIYECNSRCKCSNTCLNRVAQQPLQLKLQVFKTENRGWGIRCLNDIPQGGFICIYAGRLLTEQGANEGGKNYGDEYLAELDYIEVVEKLKEGYESDVVEDGNDSLEEEEEEEKGITESRKTKVTQARPESSASEDEEEEAENSQDTRDSDEEFQITPWTKQKSASSSEQNSIRTRLRNRSSRHGSEDSQADSREKEKDRDDRDSDKASSDGRDSRKGDGHKKISRSVSSSDHNFSDDEDAEQLRQPSRFAVVSEPKESEKIKKPKCRSVREFFGTDEYCYIMDAKNDGNIGRYLNHSCSPNVFVQNVFVDTHDLRFPWVAFFALTYIHAGTELTWDYNYDVGSVPGKVLHCYCGSNDCRGRLL